MSKPQITRIRTAKPDKLLTRANILLSTSMVAYLLKGARDELATTDMTIERPTPDPCFRVLDTGILGFRLTDSKEGKPVWLDVINRVKVCEHGVSMSQMHHWRCTSSSRPKPFWLQHCQCDTKGLYTDPKARPTLPADLEVPSYASVLWRDRLPERLPSTSVLAVRVPGLSKGREVWMDAGGTSRCKHGFSESALARHQQKHPQRAALLLQEWWRLLDHEERSSVHEALLHATPSKRLASAASIWRHTSEHRREMRRSEANQAVVAATAGKRKRGRAWPHPCGCCRCGLRREIFGTASRPGRTEPKKARAHGATPTTSDAAPDANRATLIELSSDHSNQQ